MAKKGVLIVQTTAYNIPGYILHCNIYYYQIFIRFLPDNYNRHIGYIYDLYILAHLTLRNAKIYFNDTVTIQASVN